MDIVKYSQCVCFHGSKNYVTGKTGHLISLSSGQSRKALKRNVEYGDIAGVEKMIVG